MPQCNNINLKYFSLKQSPSYYEVLLEKIFIFTLINIYNLCISVGTVSVQKRSIPNTRKKIQKPSNKKMMEVVTTEVKNVQLSRFLISFAVMSHY